MTAFRALAVDDAKPLRVVTLPRSAFKPTWDERPVEDALVGISVVSVADVADAKAQAAAYANRMGDDVDARVDLYNDALVSLLVARGTTNPHNVREPYFGLMADDQVSLALTPDGARRLYEEIVVTAVEASPLAPEASDDVLVDMLVRIGNAPAPLASRLRRVLGYVARQLDEAGILCPRSSSRSARRSTPT
jgi:hypothetical protein